MNKREADTIIDAIRQLVDKHVEDVPAKQVAEGGQRMSDMTMKTFRVVVSQTIESVVEIEAFNAEEACLLVKSGDADVALAPSERVAFEILKIEEMLDSAPASGVKE